MKNHVSAATLCLFVLCLFQHHGAVANQRPFSEVQSGTLLMREFDSRNHRTSGLYSPAPIVETQIDVSITGMLARTRLSQSFKNESPHWLEAVYVFPLPDSAGVDKLRMVIGEKIIDGVIKRKATAEKIYQKARSSGQKASLLDQQRNNLFTSHIANIPPGEHINIEIEFQSQVRYLDGSFGFDFPLTITPRYIPGQRLQSSAASTDSTHYQPTASGWATVQDADLITPPMTEPYDGPTTRITVAIDAGLAIDSIESDSHAISSTRAGDLWKVTLQNNKVVMDRDFSLRWHPEPGHSPHAAVFRQDRSTETNYDSFASIMLVPPQDLFNAQDTAREVIFVIDTSGSMQGSSIVQARNALRMGIERLSDQDTFNVIDFNDVTRTLFSSAVIASSMNRKNAIKRVASLSANGGTEIMAAMRDALKSQRSDADRLRQVIFITDGSVGNEDQIFQYIQQNIKNSRLFTIGIGSAPNTWFMRKAAELGRGSYTSIRTQQEVSNTMLALFNKLEKPVLTNISLNWSGVDQPEQYPATIPDLYAGEPVLADARWNDPVTDGALIITGTHAGRQWQKQLQLKPTAASIDPVNRDLHKRWAKRKIESLEDNLLFGGDRESTIRTITDTALDYSLVSNYTSLVAVEQIIQRDPQIAPLATAAAPSAMPFGNTMALPQGSLGIGFRFFISMMFSLLAVVFGLATLQQVRTHA